MGLKANTMEYMHVLRSGGTGEHWKHVSLAAVAQFSRVVSVVVGFLWKFMGLMGCLHLY